MELEASLLPRSSTSIAVGVVARAAASSVLPAVLLFLVLSSRPAAAHVGSAPAGAAGSRGGRSAWEVLPPAVVVHGRTGRNSDINGVYMRDFTWQCKVGPCYRRDGAQGQKTIFLYYDGEWRMGPSPQEGSVWAFAPSSAPSPLLIDAPWEVWDGKRVEQDTKLRVSDTSVIPSVLFLSFGGGADVPPALRATQGMLLQQPGLWDGRPYYRHQAWTELYLLCSVAEGRWRLGPLPVFAVGASRSRGVPLDISAALFAVSAAALPHEIVEPWHAVTSDQGHIVLAEGAVRLASAIATVGIPGPTVSAPPHRPRHLVVEGAEVADGLANGVYRRAAEELAHRPVYHKTDALRPASLWFSGGEWCLGLSAPEGPAWTCAASAALSPLGVGDTPWRRLDRSADQHGTEHGRIFADMEEGIRIADAAQAIPKELSVSGQRFVQQHQLCDARPVYVRASGFVHSHHADEDLNGIVAGRSCGDQSGKSSCRRYDISNGVAPGGFRNIFADDGPGGSIGGDDKVYMFYRVQEGEWWLGPTVGGTDCLARATASRLRVVPAPQELIWRAPSLPAVAGARSSQNGLDANQQQPMPAGLMGDMSVFGDDTGIAPLPSADHLNVAAVFQDIAVYSWVWWGFAVVGLLLAYTRLGLSCSVIVQARGVTLAGALFADEDRDDQIVANVTGGTLTPTRKACGGGTVSRTRKASVLACVVCFEAPREILLMPCRHVCCCKACADRLELCPMCRTQTTAFTKVFL